MSLKTTTGLPRRTTYPSCITGAAEKVGRILKKYDMQVRFRIARSTQKHLPIAKGRIAKNCVQGISKVTCQWAHYYDKQTRGAIEVRRKKYETIAIYMHQAPHKIDFNNVKVIIATKNYKK